MKKVLRRAGKRAMQVSFTFVIFGFLDNFVMVIAGNAIDTHITAALGISAMFAAGIGNTLSDAIGIFAGRWMDHRFSRFTEPEEGDEPSRMLILFGETVGIIIGCLLGMIPLIWL